MAAEPVDLAVLLLLGGVTYLTRAGGLWLVRRLPPSAFMERWLPQIPGAVFAALSAPLVIEAGPAGWIGGALAFALMRWRGNFFLALAAGFAATMLLSLAMKV